jgi:hypothetical protein
MIDNQSKSIIPTQSGASPAVSEVDSFLADLRQRRRSIVDKPLARGRLIFGLDATASRQPTWDMACQLQAEMFREATAVGSLELQLVFYRGLGECRGSRWISNPEQLAKTMSQIVCRAGETQIGRVLSHASKETKLLRVSALVFVGDAVEENPDGLAPGAGELGRLGVPAFMFQEGSSREVEREFREIARLTHGAYCRFDPGAARQLAELLRAVAAYAAGGMTALAARQDNSAIKLLGQLR